MGRAGRGGGGGGSFGGSRGFGSHSGGSSHRSSFSSSSHHSSYHSSYHSSHHSSYHSSSSGDFVGGYILGSIISGSNPRRRSVSSTKSSDKTGLIIFIIVFCLYLLAELIPDSSAGGIQKSTVEREKLDSPSQSVSQDYYEDHLGWIKSSSVLEDGMKHFYEETGVQPYLVITDDIGGNDYSKAAEKKYANEVYDAHFTDQAHLVLVFQEKDGQYHSFYLVGTEAKTVIDDEAGEILLDYIDHYYYSDLDEDEMFSKAFRESADRMMTVTPKYGWIALIFVLIIVVLVVLLTWWSKKKKAKLAEMNKAQQILDQDLNSFSTAGYQSNAGATVNNPTPAPNIYDTSEVDELKKKYDNMDNNINT